MTNRTIAAERRTEKGKGPARQLRMQGRVPAVVYGRGREPEQLSISLTEFERTMVATSGATIVELSIEGDAVIQTLVREVQRHPFRPGIVHVDFLEIQQGVEVTVSVPIHLEGVPEGVRTHGGTLDQGLREIEIEVLPSHIPSRVDVDVSHLGIGDSIHVSDLKIENATVLLESTVTVCSVIAPRVEEEAVAPAEEEAAAVGEEPELIRKPKAEETEDGEE